MAAETLVSESTDPLGGLIGPSLFPRTVRASADGPVPSDFKDLVSIHNYMKSLELRSPEKLMNEAKRIVDGGAELLESNLMSFAKNVGVRDAVPAKGKDRPQERRQGIGLARKTARFSLKTSVSQPSVNLEPALNFDQLEDPEEFFAANDRIENAKKEIQKQLGGSMDTLNQNNPSTNARRRRPGILGRSYSYKHRDSLAHSENDDILMPSQETVEQDLPSEVEDDSQEKLISPDQNPDIDLEKIEVAVSVKKTENEVSDILDELLSFDNEDLDGDGALNLLQERLHIKPLDRENLYIPELYDVGKSRKGSLIIDSVLKSLNRKPLMERAQVANSVNPVSSPTPPRSPFASISLLKKKILQSNPLKDPFSPVNADFSAKQSASSIRPIDKLHHQVDASKDLGMYSEVQSHVEVDLSAVRDTSPIRPMDKLEQVDAQKDLTLSCQLESHVEVCITEPTNSNMDAWEATANADNLPEQFVDESVSIIANADSSPNEEPDNNIEKTMNLNDNQSYPSVFEDEAVDDPSSRQQTDPEQQPELGKAELKRGKREAGAGRSKKTHPTRKRLAEQSNSSVLEDGAIDDPSNRQQTDPEQQSEVHQAKILKRKREAGEKRIKMAHPMRKSLAEAGTSFDNGVRRSKRIRMRPLEYWKGERFLYGRVNDSLKLLGVRYFSPGKGDENLKVKPYISSNKYKELLEMAARY